MYLEYSIPKQVGIDYILIMFKLLAILFFILIAQLEQVKYEGEQVAHQVCVLQKRPGEYGCRNNTKEATIGAEVTIGQGDVIKDFAVTSNVKAGIGGLVEGEVSGRFAAEGGPAIDTNAGIIQPEFLTGWK